MKKEESKDLKIKKITKDEIEVNKFKEKYKDLFKERLTGDTICKVIKHRIITETEEPVVQRNFQVPKLIENEVDQEIKALEKNGIIENSESPWASSIVAVRKKTGKLRICIDYRKLNAITIKDSYPIPRIDEILDELSNARIFSTLDATSGYHQLELDERDKHKTAFRWKGGFYQFKRMPFGLCNAPATFQRCMDSVLKEVNGKCAIPYLDDIIIYSKSVEDHRRDLAKVLELIKEAGLVLNEEKCNFFKYEIKILGNIISQGCIMPDPEKTKAINNYKLPTNIKELRAFLGLINYCRGFIPDLAAKSVSLNEMLKGEAKNSIKQITWTDEALEAFRNVKKLLSEETRRNPT